MAQRPTPERGAAPDRGPESSIPDLEAVKRAAEDWRKTVVSPSIARMPPRRSRFSTWSDLEVPDVLTPADVPIDYVRDLGMPG
jgi:methylmalonyl-CoA mutase, N-terminal domain